MCASKTTPLPFGDKNKNYFFLIFFPLVNLILLLFILLLLLYSFPFVQGIEIRLPQEIYALNSSLILTVKENNFYMEKNKPLSLKELENILSQKRYNSLFLKSERNVSLALLAELWNICKRLNIERIGITTLSE